MNFTSTKKKETAIFCELKKKKLVQRKNLEGILTGPVSSWWNYEQV